MGPRESIAAEARRRGLSYYQVRVERARAIHGESTTARQAAGHIPPGTPARRAPAFLAGQATPVDVEVDKATQRRLGKYADMVDNLLRGRLSDEEFDRHWGRRAPIRARGGDVPEGRYRVSTAAEVRAQVDAMRAQDRDLPDWEGSG